MEDKKTEARKNVNNILFSKILDFIEHFYPGIYEESQEEYIKEDEDRFKVLKDKQNFQEDYNAWFLTKMLLPNGVSVVQMAKSFPDSYFTRDEKKMLNNLFNYNESLFTILSVSKDNKNYEIMDFADSKIYKIKTFDLPNKFKKGDIISAFIVRDIENSYFFLGGIVSWNVTNKLEFVSAFMMKKKLEEALRKRRNQIEIDWEIEREEPENKEDLWEEKTKINGVWVDDKTGKVLEGEDED